MKKIIYIIISLISIVSLCGCWDRKEPKDLALINSVIYDLNDEEGYEVTIEIKNPSATGTSQTSSGSGKNTIITESEKGESIPEALRKVSNNLERTLFGGQNKVRFFSEKFAKKDMYGVTDFLSRGFITDEKSYIIIIKNPDPKIIYETQTGLTEVVGDFIESLRKNQPRTYNQSTFMPTLKFIQELFCEGKEPVAGVVEVIPFDNKPLQEQQSNDESENTIQTTKLIYEGLAAFKDGKLVGYFDDVEARAYNFLLNDTKRTIFSVTDEKENTVVANVIQSKCDIKAKPKGNDIYFETELAVKLFIAQIDGDLDISEREIEEKFEQLFNNKIKEQIENAIKKAQTEFKSDIFGFGNYLHIQNPKIWKNVKDKWNDKFSKVAINVKVDTSIKFDGGFKKSIEQEATN